MITIWKFPLKVQDWNVVKMPKGARILDAQFQGSTLTAWAIVDTEASKEERYILVAGTGNPLPSQVPDRAIHFHHSLLKHITTVQDPYSAAPAMLVWHIFEPPTAS